MARQRQQRNSIGRGRRLNLESLEDRRLLAVVPQGFTETVLASGLTSPTTLDVEESGRIWVAYQDGRIEVIEDGTPGTTLAYQLDADGSAEHGLQGIELDPDFDSNGYLYVYYTANSPSPHNRLSRLTVDPTTENTILPGSELVLLDLPDLSEYGNPPWHIGGAVHFGLDGMLLVQIGESQQAALSQDLESPLGKILRVDPSTGDPLSDNPFYDAGDGITWRDHVWALGLRNPFAGDLDPVTGRYLVADVGGGSWEEINDATQPGLNFGWPTTEGAFNPNTFPNFTAPLYAYPHSEGCAITGLAINCATTQFPAQYDGKVFFAEFCRGEIRVVDPDNPTDVEVFATGAAFPMNIEFGADGSMYYISRGAGAGGAPGTGAASIRKVQYVANVPPQIVLAPGDTLASVGYDATFSASAAGTDPLIYQWQRFDGADFVDMVGETSEVLVVPGVALTNNGDRYRVVVTNAFGEATSAAATLSVTTDTPPSPAIDAPDSGTTYRAGDIIDFSGLATDTEDGALDAADLTWRVDFHHNTHSHPFIPPTSGLTGGQFAIPTATETDHDVWYRITLEATDSAGLSTSTFFDLLPEKTNFVIETNLPGGGGALTLDNAAVAAPRSVTGVENVQRTFEVPASQIVDGKLGFFDQWIDGDTNRQRTISTPHDDTAYVALYRGVSGTPIYLSDLPTVGTPINGWGPIELDRSNGETGAADGNTITLNGVTYAKGLGVHAYSEVTYNLGGGFSRFISDIGVDDENAPGGSVEFQVLADGNEVFASGVMTNASPTQTVSIDISGVNELKLIVTNAGDGDGADHADWADARLFTDDAAPVVNINFQLGAAPVPAGYLPDGGLTFGDRGNGWDYGWSTDHTDLARDREINADQRLDTLVHFHEGQNWEIALPNGQYMVTVSIGDAGFPDGSHTLNVEGQNYWTNEVLGTNQFAAQTQLVTVSDGRLTLDSGDAGEKKTRINYVQIATPGEGVGLFPYSSADATLDGHLDQSDVVALLSHWQADTSGQTPAEQVAAGDFDFSGVVDSADWTLLSDAWDARYGATLALDDLLATLAGDYDRSGEVDENDYATWKEAFGGGLDLEADGQLLAADGNFDGSVDAADYTRWRDNLGRQLSADLPAPAVAAATAQAARDELLLGVSNIAITGAPGQIAVFDPPGAAAGEGAFAVMHDGDFRPMVAAAIWGSGRVVAFGHNGYTNFGDVGNQLDTGRFYQNSVAWTTGLAGKNQVIVTSSTSTRNWLQSQGYTNVTQSANWQNLLAGADLLIVELGPNVSAARQTAVSNFVQGGGGLITGGTGWGYKSLGNDLTTMDGNVVLREAGIAWADGFRNAATNATNRSTELANASRALAFVQAFWAGGSATTNQKNEAGEALQTVLDVLPADHPLAIDIGNAFSARATTISATPATPVSDPLDQAVLTWESNQLAATPVAQVTAHHTAEAVYGAIPAGAPRVTETVTLDTTQSRWRATGLYAAPGEVVTVTVPASLVNRGYKIRVNAHTDDISQRDAWERMPVVHRSFDIQATSVDVASAFGGSIFIDFGGDAYSAPPSLGDVDIQVAGAVRQPYFVLGEHTDQEWVDTLRDQPAPYAVFVSDNLMIVQRSSESSTLTEPTALMSWWKEVVDQQDALASRLQPRTGPEIINVDVQISAGSAHAGFPIQAYDIFWGNLADWDRLPVEGSWGDFHELGHNHQRGWWTFDGDGEVTVNIFSNYNLENQASASTDFWAYSADPVATIQTAINNISGGGTYSGKSDRWSFWFQLADGFGWQAYENVFAGYEADLASSPAALPSNNQAEKDQWLVRWSNEVGYDMKRFMVDTWGLEVSQSAINSVAALPDWMPLASTITDFQIDAGETRVINAATGGLGMDGVATFVGVTQPALGTLADNGNGTYTYQPTVDGGVDSFAVSYQSSAGNIQQFTVSVTIGNGTIPGDVDQNGVLDTNDVAQFVAGWRSDTTGLEDPGKISLGDLNLDGATNFSDWAILRRAWINKFGDSLNLAELLSGSSPALAVAEMTADTAQLVPSAIGLEPIQTFGSDADFATMPANAAALSGSSTPSTSGAVGPAAGSDLSITETHRQRALELLDDHRQRREVEFKSRSERKSDWNPRDQQETYEVAWEAFGGEEAFVFHRVRSYQRA